LLIGLDVGIGAFDPIKLAVVVERSVAGPHPAHDIEIFAGAPVTIGLGQEVAFAGLILFGGAGNDVQRHPALGELVEGCDLPRRQHGRDGTWPMRNQKFYSRGVGRIARWRNLRRGRNIHQHGM
jgi:hypothetical protein